MRGWFRHQRLWLPLVAVSLVLVAFGGTGAAATDRAHAAAPVTLVYFNARMAEPVERALIQQYMRDHPNIKIKYLSTTSLSGPSDTDAIANLIFNIQAHTVIDVAKVETSRTPLDLATAKSILNLEKIGGSAVKSRLKQLLNTEYVSFSSGIWALPYEYDPFGYIYNGTLFKQVGLDPNKPPKSWDQLRAIDKTIKSKMPNTWPICQPIDNLSKTEPYVWGAGGDYWNRPMLPTKATFLNPAVVAAYSFVQEWARNGWMNTSELTSDQTGLRWMISNRCAAMNYSASFVLTLNLNDPGVDWRVAPIPGRTTSNKPVNFAGGSSLVIPATSKHPKEALDFILWLTSQEGQRLKFGLGKSLGVAKQDLYGQALPANREVAQQLSKQAAWKQASATVNVPTRAAGTSPVYSKIYQILADMQSRIVLKDANVKQQLTAAQQQAQKLLDQAVKANPQLYASQ